eukprot:364360-Chlamydomonas_euryale.AAC.5
MPSAGGQQAPARAAERQARARPTGGFPTHAARTQPHLRSKELRHHETRGCVCRHVHALKATAHNCNVHAASPAAPGTWPS